MFMFCEKYLHEVINTKEGIMLIDVTNTPDCGWESAYALINMDAFKRCWESDNYTFQDIKEWAEEFDAIEGWTVVSNNHRKPEAAEKKLRQFIKKNFD